MSQTPFASGRAQYGPVTPKSLRTPATVPATPTSPTAMKSGQRVTLLVPPNSTTQTQRSLRLSPKTPVRKPAAALGLTSPAASASQRKADYFAKLFFNAAAEGNLQVLASLLDAQQIDINHLDDQGRTGVHYAASFGHAHVIRFLVDYGADLDAPDSEGATPLQLAAAGGYLEAAKLLLDLGAVITSTDRNGYTAVHWAMTSQDQETIMYFLKRSDRERNTLKGASDISLLNVAAGSGEWDACQHLLSRGEDINVADGSGRMPLHAAVATNKSAVAKALVARGAKMTLLDRDGRSPLWIAVANGATQCVDLLLEFGCNPNERDGHQVTLLHVAASVDNVDVIDLLVDKGAAVNRIDKMGRTPLHHAVFHAQPRCVARLLERMADVAAPDNMGQTPLHYAATVGDVSIISKLLSKNGDALKEDTEGWTPLQLAVDEGNIGVVVAMVEAGAREGALHWAALCGRDDVGKALLERGCRSSERDPQGRTALHRAAGKNHVSFGHLLLDYSADVEAKDRAGRTSLDYAATNGATEFLALLLRVGASVACRDSQRMSPLHKAAYHGQSEAVKMLIEHKLDVQSMDLMGNSAVHTAALGGQPECLTLLLEAESNLLQTNAEGDTPLHLAAAGGSLSFTIAYFKHVLAQHGQGYDLGVIINAMNNDGRTALHFAAAYGHPELVTFLCGQRANVNAMDKEDRSALMHAVINSQPACIEALCEAGADVKLRDKTGRMALDYAVELKLRDLTALLIKHGAEMKYLQPTTTKPLEVEAIAGTSSRIRQLQRLLDAQRLSASVANPRRTHAELMSFDDVAAAEDSKQELDKLREMAQKQAEQIERMRSIVDSNEAKLEHSNTINKQLVWQLSRARAAAAALAVGQRGSQLALNVDQTVESQMQALAVKATEAETQRLQMQLMCEHEVVQATMQFLVDKTISGHLHEQQANEIDALNRRINAQQRQYDAERVVWEQQRATMQLTIEGLKQEIVQETERLSKEIAQMEDQMRAEGRNFELKLQERKLELEQEKMRMQQLLRQEHASYVALDEERQQVMKQLDQLHAEKEREIRLVKEDAAAQLEQLRAENANEMAKIAEQLSKGAAAGDAISQLKDVMAAKTALQHEVADLRHQLTQANDAASAAQQETIKAKEDWVKAVGELRDQLEDRDKEISTLNERLSSAQDHVAELTSSLAATTQQMRELTRTKKALDSCQMTLHATEEMLRSTREQLDETTAELRTVRESGGREAQLEVEVQRLKRESADRMAEMAQTITLHEQQLQKATEKIQRQEARMKGLDAEMSDLQDQLAKRTEELEETVHTLREYERKQARYQLELEAEANKRLADKLEIESQAQYSIAQAKQEAAAEIDKVHRRATQLEKELGDMSTQRDSALKRVEQVLAEVAQARAERDATVSRTVNDCQTEIQVITDKLTSRLLSVEQSRDTIKAAKEGTEKELLDARKMLSDLRAQASKLERELDTRNTVNCELADASHEYQQRIADLEELLRDERAAAQVRDQAQASMEAEIARLTAEIVAEHNEIVSLQRTLADTNAIFAQEREKMTKDNLDVKAELSKERANLAAFRENSAKDMAEMQEKCDKLTQSLNTTEMARSHLEEELARLLSDMMGDQRGAYHAVPQGNLPLPSTRQSFPSSVPPLSSPKSRGLSVSPARSRPSSTLPVNTSQPRRFSPHPMRALSSHTTPEEWASTMQAAAAQRSVSAQQQSRPPSAERRPAGKGEERSYSRMSSYLQDMLAERRRNFAEKVATFAMGGSTM